MWIRSDLGPYAVSSRIELSAGGYPGAPIVIRGVGRDWHTPGRPVFTGGRASPWKVGGAEGTSVFRLLPGADHLHFLNLSYRDVKYGWDVAGPVKDLTIENVEANNLTRLLENYAGTGYDSASISQLKFKDVAARGYSRAVARVQFDSSNVLMEDVFGDSEGQPSDSFSTGLVFDHTAHDVVVRRAVMLNHRQSLGADAYWNADGFSNERGNYNFTFEDTFAAGNTDGGYDLKSTGTVLNRPVSIDNKRNYRIWGVAEINNCQALSPLKRGGSGSQAQFQVSEKGTLKVNACTIKDQSADTVAFDLFKDASAAVSGGCLQLAPTAVRQSLGENATLTFQGVAACP